MWDVPDGLRAGLDELLDGVAPGPLGRAVDALIARYREDTAAPAAILDSPVAVRAYAAYRMPATYAAARDALERFAERADGFRPRTLVDVGGGTGAAVWAAADAFGSLESATVLERSPEVVAVGRALAASGGLPVAAEWRPAVLGAARPDPAVLPEADLQTACYVLGELGEAERAALVGAMAERGRAVLVVEPGTPAGYRRVLDARRALIAAGMRVVAPCPHDGVCPVEADGRDWCHFAARVPRSALHRRVKGAELGHEDEKFAYVVASREGFGPASGRVIRHPQRRKGMVEMRVCGEEGEVSRTIVSKRAGARYRAAKAVAWGDVWEG